MTSGERGPFRHDDWQSRLLHGHPATVARAITVVENEAPFARKVLAAVYEHTGRASVVGVTGAPGVGKSSLVSALVRELRGGGGSGGGGRSRTVAVIAVDPSSPVTGGAILGDRVRMGEHAADAGVFVRSLASRGHLGGLTAMTGRVVDVLDAAGYEVIILETVGAGQSEVEIAGSAQTTVVVLAPGMGDDIQAHKAGILEIADVLVVNKADHPLAGQAVDQLREALRHAGPKGRDVPVLSTVATDGTGLPELVRAVDAHAAALAAAMQDAAVRSGAGSGSAVDRSAVSRSPARKRALALLSNAAERLARRRVQALRGATLDALTEAVLKGELDVDEAAAEALQAALEDSDPS